MDKKLVGLVTLFFISFAIFTSILVFQKPLSGLARASEDFTPSAENTKILVGCGTPILQADGKDNCPLYIFVRGGGSTPKPLANKNVTLTTTAGTLSPTTATTDNLGKATFTISSSSPGMAVITATVQHNETPVAISQTVTLEFK